uniref:DUF4781 domain-containing protein n=1 Tax=Cuerna arida TaxID=1464854 RepID=A0A1B6GEL0_9HEMI
MADDWKLKAAHEQFDIFDTLFVQNTTCTNTGELLKQVDIIKNNHLRWPKITPEPTKKLLAEIVKACDGHGLKNYTFSFTVIVSNEKNGDKLCKMPIFVINNGNKTTFIDLNCSNYQSWNLYLKNNNLPSCEFCFPVDGLYIVGGKLRIDFAKSQVGQLHIWKERLFSFGCFVLVSAIAVVTCVFFKVQGTTIDSIFSNLLLPIAEKFLSDSLPLLKLLKKLLKIVSMIQQGNQSLLLLMNYAFRILIEIRDMYEKEITEAFESVKREMKKSFEYLRKLFKWNSKSEEKAETISLFAKANRTDAIVRMLMSDSKNQLNASINPDSPVNNVREIFENSKTECAFSVSEKDYDDFHPNTRNLLEISKNIANNLKSETLTDQDIFEAFSTMVIDEYNQNVEDYTKTSNALRDRFNLSSTEINDILGIEGDFKGYFWNKAIQSAKELRFGMKMKEKLEEFKLNKKVTLNLLARSNSGDFYVCVGKQVGILISTEDFVNVLSEKEIYVHKNHVINKKGNMYVQSEEYVILLQQSSDTESVTEGFVFIQRKGA